EAHQGWEGLAGAVRTAAGTCRYHLATLGAARGLRSSYCSLAHGKVLAERVVGEAGLRRLLDGEEGDGVDATDLAVVALAEKVGRGGADGTADALAAPRAARLDDGGIGR